MLAVPSAFVTMATSGAKAPALPARNMASTGMIVTKMPANSAATSVIGVHENPFARDSPSA